MENWDGKVRSELHAKLRAMRHVDLHSWRPHLAPAHDRHAQRMQNPGVSFLILQTARQLYRGLFAHSIVARRNMGAGFPWFEPSILILEVNIL